MPKLCLMTKSWRYSAGWIAQMIAQSIAERGTSITYIAPLAEPLTREPSHANLHRVHTPRELVGEGHSTIKRSAASLSRIFAGMWHVLRFRSSIASYIFTIPEPLFFTLPLFAILRMTGAKVIYIVHDAQPHAWSLPHRFRSIERIAHRWAYMLASVIVTLTPSVGIALTRDFQVASSKIKTIPHGPLAIGDVVPIPGDRKLLIFGALRRNKGILDAIKGTLLARKQGLSVRLVLAGEPLKQEPGYWDECLHLMAQDPAGFDIRVGFVADDALPALISEVDAFVLAYRDFDSQSGVGVLAALAGRPVIGTRVGGLAQLFEMGMVGKLIDEPVTPEGFSSAITEFYRQDLAHWQREAERGKILISQTLRWDAIADAYIHAAESNLRQN
jgi:glycosyltransferase involved in cell wall biosynthesis